MCLWLDGKGGLFRVIRDGFREEDGAQLRQNHGIDLFAQPVNLVQSLMQQPKL
jgi:hypothetical protein